MLALHANLTGLDAEGAMTAIGDGGCTFRGCGRPPGWCDAAHRGVRWWQGGQMRLDALALLCCPHHRMVDEQGWTGTIKGGKVVWQRPLRQPSHPP